MVPNGWSVKPLSNITKWSSGGTPSKSNPAFWNGNIPWISATSMRGLYYSDSEMKITELAVANKAKMAPENSLLLLVRGSMLWNKIPVGITTRKVSFNQDVKCLEPDTKKTNSKFLLYWFLTNEHLLMNMVTGTGIGAGKLDTTDLQNLDIYLPPLPEQRKIAKILGTWDKAITTTEKLIATSKQQKKSLMQQLLTGKKRLLNPETGNAFEGEWEDIKLPDFAWFQEGPGLRKWQFTDSGCKVINITNIVNGYLDLSKTERHISDAELAGKYRHFLCDAGDIVIASSGNSYCKHGLVRQQDLPLVMNTSVIRFKPLGNCDYNFLNQFLKSKYLKQQIDVLITGGAQPNFGPVHLKQIKLNLPPRNEQQKIASVLTAADKEIELLDAKLALFKQEKKALMQQLLTGKRRVKVDKPEAA